MALPVVVGEQVAVPGAARGAAPVAARAAVPAVPVAARAGVPVSASAEDPHTIVGEVVPGDQRGRMLGFPTANIDIDADRAVRNGVWAAEVTVEGVTHWATVSIGTRPTFYADRGIRLVEAFVLDFHGDLYGRQLTVALRSYLRPQRAFDGSGPLIRQMRIDVDRTRAWFAAAPRGGRRSSRDAGRAVAGDGGRVPGRQNARASGRENARVPGSIGRRRSRSRDQIEAAVREAIARDQLTHDLVAELTQLPLGLVRWLCPTVDDLTEFSAGQPA